MVGHTCDCILAMFVPRVQDLIRMMNSTHFMIQLTNEIIEN